MKLRTSLTQRYISVFAGIAGAGLLIQAQNAQAATVPAPAEGDLFVGFRATDGTGSATSYLVKLGSDTLFRNTTAGTTITLSLGNLGSDLIATYGADWNTRSDVQWGIFGSRNGTVATVYASKARTTPSVAATDWPVLSNQQRASALSAISSVVFYTNGYSGATATANSSVGTLQTNSNNASSYNYQVGSSGTTDFGSLSQWSSIEGNFGSGASNAALDLFRFANATTVSRLGVFTINSSGQISFTAAAAGFTGWATTKGLTASNNGQTQDPDNDGLSNLTEYVLGSEPLTPSPSAQPQVSTTATQLVFSYQRSINANADTTQAVEWSTNLSTWSSVAVGSASSGTVTVSSASSTAQNVSVSIPLSNAVGGKLFARLRVTKP